MAITLPQDIQDLEIPPGMDARGGDLSARETFERAQKADFAARDAQQLFERQISGATELTGEQANTASAAHTAQRDAEEKAKRKQSSDTLEMQLLLATQHLQDYEAGLAQQYGEDFDLDLLGELAEKGYFTDEQYAEFASIEDIEARRVAIAEAIQEGIDSGRIDPADLKNHPWAQEWLEKHERVADIRKMQAENALEGNYNRETMASAMDQALTGEGEQNAEIAEKIEDDIVAEDQGAQQVSEVQSFSSPPPILI
ncbi:hypothetical protein [Henriciella algicola]|uniref:Uncharacterized protein n=1 Tax=Henriciella algicola TaxID=1608422 RepID=A0A399RL94_9PROT|nr:hypothetical protein [Henriciella algicola]RIJ31054.1 hypothetical protein D1222_01945 [Henriciella algicola]